MLIDRRIFLLMMAGASFAPARAQTHAMSRMTAFAFHFAGLDGSDIQLSEYIGRPILIVKTASQYGYKPQYAGLKKLDARTRLNHSCHRTSFAPETV